MDFCRIGHTLTYWCFALRFGYHRQRKLVHYCLFLKKCVQINLYTIRFYIRNIFPHLIIHVDQLIYFKDFYRKGCDLVKCLQHILCILADILLVCTFCRNESKIVVVLFRFIWLLFTKRKPCIMRKNVVLWPRGSTF